MRRFWAAILAAVLVFQWSMMTDAPANMVHWLMSTTSAIAQASGTVASGLANQIAYYASNGTTVQGLTAVANGVPSYNNGGVLSVSTTLPSGLTAPNLVATGIPTAPTATCATNSAQTATTQFAKNCIPQLFSIGWLAGANPNGGIVIAHAPQALSISTMFCRLTANGDTGATLAVYQAPPGSEGTAPPAAAIATTGCDLGVGKVNADQPMTLTSSSTIPAGNSVYLVTSGTIALSAGSVGMIATY
jgi:hypothetical protein